MLDPDGLAPHERLLVQLVRRDEVGASTEVGRGLLEERGERARLVRLAMRHGVLGLVLSSLFRSPSAASLSVGVAQELQHRWTRLRRQAALWDLERDRLLSHLAREGLAPVILKGGALRETAYREPAERSMGDLDLLVPPDQFEAARTVLERAGYRTIETGETRDAYRLHHFHLSLAHPNGSMVELHWALSRPGGGFRLDERAVLARAVARPSAAGPAGRVPSAEDMVLHLASQNEEDAFGRLRRLVDIDRVVALAPRLDWSYLRESAGKARAQTLLALSLRLAQRLLDTPVPRGFVESLRLSRLCRLNLALLRPVSWLMTPDGQRPAVAAELLLLWTTVGWRSRLQRCLVFAWPHSDALAAAWRTEIDEVVERRARGPRRLWVLAKLVAYQLWVYGRGLVAVFTSSGRRSLRFWSGRSTAGAMAARVLAAILPSPEETWLLRACLLPDTWAREAWAAYEREAGDLVQVFRHDRRGLKMLGPLLNGAAHRSAFDASPGVLTVLRTAALREDLRSREYRRIVGEVLSALGAAEVPAVVVGGAALGELVYAGPALRHSHDAEFLLREVDVPRALSALAARGLGRPAVAGQAWTVVEHPSGLPLVLRRDLLPERFYSSFTEEAWAASERQTIAGVPARALSRIDNLLHVCGRAFCSPERDSLLWICDAWLLTAQEPGLDWDRMIERATASRLVLPVGVVLDYLARELDAPVPAPVLARLRAAVDAISPIARDVALFGVRVGGRSSLAELLRAAGGPRDRLRLLGWLLFPSPAYMRHAYGLESAAWLPLSYVRRTLGYVAARLRSRLPRDPGRQRGLEESSPDRAL